MNHAFEVLAYAGYRGEQEPRIVPPGLAGAADESPDPLYEIPILLITALTGICLRASQPEGHRLRRHVLYRITRPG